MARRKFRKVWVICMNNDTFNNGMFHAVHMYRSKANAEQICKQYIQRDKDEAGHASNVNKPVNTYKVHGFYLIHEAYFKDGEG